VNLLLDTHIWLWSLLDPARLGSRVREALEAHEHELWLSPISVWETLVLAERGRLALAPEPETWVRTSLARSPVIEAPLTIEVAIESRRVNLSHEDPADRFLAATARVYDLTLVTADARLLAVPDLALLANE
jgi:PIN domain nuclease of toxin-antitoxin system